jgi:hypothetical protein
VPMRRRWRVGPWAGCGRLTPPSTTLRSNSALKFGVAVPSRSPLRRGSHSFLHPPVPVHGHVDLFGIASELALVSKTGRDPARRAAPDPVGKVSVCPGVRVDQRIGAGDWEEVARVLEGFQCAPADAGHAEGRPPGRRCRCCPWGLLPPRRRRGAAPAPVGKRPFSVRHPWPTAWVRGHFPSCG